MPKRRNRKEPSLRAGDVPSLFNIAKGFLSGEYGSYSDVTAKAKRTATKRKARKAVGELKKFDKKLKHFDMRKNKERIK